MSEMVSRVSEAIDKAVAEWQPGTEIKIKEAAARAAIAAMREPTNEMWAKGTEARLDDAPSTHRVWWAMIDEALR